MKGKFDAYVLWPMAKWVQIWIVDGSTARNFTVNHNLIFVPWVWIFNLGMIEPLALTILQQNWTFVKQIWSSILVQFCSVPISLILYSLFI